MFRPVKKQSSPQHDAETFLSVTPVSTVKSYMFFMRVACGYRLNWRIVSGDKEVKAVANFFSLNPLETLMAFRRAKTGATTV